MHREDSEIKSKVNSYLQVYLKTINKKGELKEDERMLFFDWLLYEAGSKEGEKFISWIAPR